MITPPNTHNPGELSVSWRDAERRARSHLVDVRIGERIVARDTRGGSVAVPVV